MEVEAHVPKTLALGWRVHVIWVTRPVLERAGSFAARGFSGFRALVVVNRARALVVE